MCPTRRRSTVASVTYTQRLLIATVAVLILAGLLTACSGDDDGSDDSAASITTTTAAAPELSAAEAAALDLEVKWNECMRDNGIQGLPDPEVTEDGFLLVGFPLVFPENWDEAQEACQYIHDDAAASEESAGGDATVGWEQVVPGGDCQCADGSEFAFWERRGRPEQGRVLPGRRRQLLRRHVLSVYRPFRRRRTGGLRLEHLGRRSGTGGRDLRLRTSRQPVPRLQLHLRAVVHR